MFRQVANIPDLLLGEPAAAHLCYREILDGLGSDLAACSFFQASVDGACGLGAQLLKYNGAGQRLKRRLTVGDAAWPHACDDGRQHFIRILEMAQGLFHGFCSYLSTIPGTLHYAGNLY